MCSQRDFQILATCCASFFLKYIGELLAEFLQDQYLPLFEYVSKKLYQNNFSI